MIIPNHPDFWHVFKETPGALSVCESMAIMYAASLAPSGIYLELGGHKGKSTMSAALTLKPGGFMVVDPCYDPNNPEFFGYGEIELLKTRLHFASYDPEFTKTKSRLMIEICGDYSLNIIPKHDNKYAYVFVDSGSHQDGLPMEEAKLLEDRIVPNGIIAWHDFKSQFVEVEQAYNYLLSTGKYEEVKIDWELIVNYVKENNLEQGNNSWHHPELEFPCFFGALRRKTTDQILDEVVNDYRQG